jgi:uncharacterized protein
MVVHPHPLVNARNGCGWTIRIELLAARIGPSYTPGVEDFLKMLANCDGFEWDTGNQRKNWERHRVSTGECEEVFFQRPILIAPDAKHSQLEKRYAALGQTTTGRLLTIVFTIRKTKYA